MLGLAVEKRYFTMPVNPLTAVKWVAPKSAEEVDPQSVANPRQARSLLQGVREQGPRDEHLEAFFGCLYYAAMRRAEATALRDSQCHLPATGWGALTLREGPVRAGRNWTDDGEAHEMRHLKARAAKDSRPVPIPPHFVCLLRQHIATYGVAPDGRLFRTNRGGLLQETGYGEVWARARKEVLPSRNTRRFSPAARMTYVTRESPSGSVRAWTPWSARGGPTTPSPSSSVSTRRCSHRRSSGRRTGSTQPCGSGTSRSEPVPRGTAGGHALIRGGIQVRQREIWGSIGPLRGPPCPHAETPSDLVSMQVGRGFTSCGGAWIRTTVG